VTWLTIAGWSPAGPPGSRAADGPGENVGAFQTEQVARYDVDHRFPFAYRDLLPYYEWVEHTLPVQTAPLGLKEQVFFDGARRLGIPLERTKDITKKAFRRSRTPSFSRRVSPVRQVTPTSSCSLRRKGAHSVGTAPRGASSHCAPRST